MKVVRAQDFVPTCYEIILNSYKTLQIIHTLLENKELGSFPFSTFVEYAG